MIANKSTTRIPIPRPAHIFCAHTSLLRDLHWLRVPERIGFRLAVLVYCCQHDIGPSYLAAELHRVADVKLRRRLRSASTTAIFVPQTSHTTIGDRAFPVAAAHVWNSLPPSVTSSPLLATFRWRLKTELFSRSFGAEGNLFHYNYLLTGRHSS